MPQRNEVCRRLTTADAEKIEGWLKKGVFKDFSFACWQRANLQLPRLLERPDVVVTALEKDGKFKVLIYAEVRTAVKNKLDVDTATRIAFIMSQDATKEDYQKLLDWTIRLGYSLGVYRADFWNLAVHAPWIIEVCGSYASVRGEVDTPIGRAVRFVLDVKGYVEK